MIARRAVAAFACLLTAAAAHAFSFSYGPYFTVTSIRRTQKDGVVLPVARKKYRNIRLLSAKAYHVLDACGENCSQEVSYMHFNIGDWRKASTREDMLIADVEFNDQWAVTFLVFKNKSGFSVKTPEDFTFQDKALQTRVTDALVALAKEQL